MVCQEKRKTGATSRELKAQEAAVHCGDRVEFTLRE